MLVINSLNQIIIKLENVSKKFGSFYAVKNVNLEVNKGDVVGFVGPNGAGKTTTIKMIANLIKPSSGNIYILNMDGKLQDISKNSRNLVKRGFLVDIPSFYKSVTAYQILRFMARAQHYPKEKIDGRIEELLKLFKLYEWRDEKVMFYSKGMTQKLGIIVSMLIDPDILILDEPQTGVDPKARLEIRTIISNLQKQGKTIFLCSHLLHEISEVCNKLAIIHKGRLVTFDTIENLEKVLTINEIYCQLLGHINTGKENSIVKKVTESIKQFLDTKIEMPVVYDPESREFKIYFDGKKESKAEILELLVSDYKSDFRIISFSQPRTNLLEQAYFEKIK